MIYFSRQKYKKNDIEADGMKNISLWYNLDAKVVFLLIKNTTRFLVNLKKPIAI
jgi:hypothetical protein